jgi:UDP-N-acetylglucosamine 2-epimerase (non-hydrolysing)/GDP/UDP-N,N'-diacetylbacillosamine 2-epimerase (hydrolysing)
MGEEAWRVHRAGAPSLDHLVKRQLYAREELETRLAVNLGKQALLVAYHPVTLLEDTTEEADALFEALATTEGQILFCYPNSDAGSRELIRRSREFVASREDGQIFTNLDALTYWSLLAQVEVLLGNSSSGIMETASFGLPTVNVGMRQKGRERAANVIDAAPKAEKILTAIARARSREFRESLKGMSNPYGDGHASERIVDELTSVPVGRELLIKRAVDLPL